MKRPLALVIIATWLWALLPAIACAHTNGGYDLISRLTSQGYSSGAPELGFAYDNAGRLTSSTQYGRTVSYSYGTPAQGLSRTMSWPGAAGSVLACSDALGRTTKVKEAPDCTTSAGWLVAYGYDDLSRQTAVIRPSGANTSYTYNDAGALASLGHGLAGGAAVADGFSYNRALQVASRSRDNDLYAWTNNYNVTRGYTANGLDQYGQAGGNAFAYDVRGNLAAYRGESWGYDGENRLAAVNRSTGTVSTSYDPAGRLRQPGATAQWLYDGDQLIAEYDAGGILAARYVPGLVQYDASGTKNWYHSDAQGSVIATSDSSGAATTIDQYGPFGESGLAASNRNQGRLRYTGQAMLAEAGDGSGIEQTLYDYRARIYAPKLGRFLQTDPIGAADDRNLYAYVRNDPINRGDPSGMFADGFGAGARESYSLSCSGCGGSVGTKIGYTLGGATIGTAQSLAEGIAGEVGGQLLGRFFGAVKSAGSIRGVNAIGGEMNCVNCVIATDATLAGRPASALGGGPFQISELEKTFGTRFGPSTTIGNIGETMSGAGNGARGVVFGSRGNAVGHVFNTVNQNGVIRFLDGQTGTAATLEGYSAFRLLRTN